MPVQIIDITGDAYDISMTVLIGNDYLPINGSENIQAQSDLQIAAEQADKNDQRYRAYQQKREAIGLKPASFENVCSQCGRKSYHLTTCQTCRNNRQQELNESYEHNCA